MTGLRSIFDRLSKDLIYEISCGVKIPKFDSRELQQNNLENYFASGDISIRFQGLSKELLIKICSEVPLVLFLHF
jgi:hypothetical protein